LFNDFDLAEIQQTSAQERASEQEEESSSSGSHVPGPTGTAQNRGMASAGSNQIVGLVLSAIIIFTLGFAGGWLGHTAATSQYLPPASAQPYARLIWDAWSDIDNNYVDQGAIDHQKMTYAAISAIVDSLGDTGHSRFETPDELKQEQQQLSGNYVGIGVVLQPDPTGQYFQIGVTFPNAPATKAGLKPGDVIIAINGKSVKGDTQDQLRSLITGPQGSSFTMTIQRPGQAQPFDVKLTREQIQAPIVTSYYFPESHIAHIMIMGFDSGTDSMLRQALTNLKKQGMQKIILDLRDNPGGYLDEAISVASEFIPAGNGRNVVLIKDRSGKITPQPVQPGGLATNLPVVVLTNNNTASAAEIVTGAIKDNHRGIVIGEHTFGTGTVLNEFDLPDGSALLLGVEEYLTPSGKFIRNGGISPDIQVAMPNPSTPENSPLLEQETNETQAQALQSKDSQFIAAYQYLQQH
jgi:carboxyl-terminal processing protease